jgi:SAM-dependent methyltransferase
VDATAGPGVDLVADLSQVTLGSLPFDSDYFDEMLAVDVVDRLPDPTALMSELYRVARPGCQLVLQLPYGSSDAAWGDPDIVRPYFLDSFSCFGQPFYWRGDRGYTGDWQLAFALVKMSRERYAHVPHEQRLADIREKRNVVKDMTAILTAMKPPRPRDRNLVTPPRLEILLVED